MNTIKNSFDTYYVTYGISSRNTTDYARIDCYLGTQKQGQILFGSSVSPGNNASQLGSEIHLYFPLDHFDSILNILQLGARQPLTLYLDLDDNNGPTMGGVTTVS